ncbi:hypothetical protein [Lentzea flaviverrucosa]|uniref:SRCR domain-containing protein n=1 Tax=Lentzea flaviverrucosa TaxID=200379 RepID=A0A1H9K8K3_9PSEU|nr:hypothetical protein [Lentzea flaviverrucosa]RDI17792.1 short repeat uncharacterized protein predicted to be involved in signal transduction [Lentzea flaviverrucosa]SEQ95546.1 Short repeat-containing protein of unknown function [Lentzea flaviverrucosa]
MNTTPTSAASLRRRSVAALILSLVLALLSSTTPAIAAPTPVPVLQQRSATSDDPVDEELEYYKLLVGDIAEHAEDVEVRDAAAAALTVGTKEKLLWFLDHGQAEAQARADQRKAAENAENRRKVTEWASTGGPNVKAGAQAALAAGDRAIADFVAYGYEIALKRDEQQAEDDKAEQDRITARVRDMVAHGGPQVQLEGGAILDSRDYAKIREFYLTGYHEANKRDHDLQLVIEKALEDRNRAITELDRIARVSTEAAKARAEIVRANMEAVKHLDDVLFAMQMAVKAAHRSDKIFQEDKAGRPNGGRGRDGELAALLAEAAEYAARAGRVLDRSAVTTQAARNAAERLVDLEVSNGLDWAKVTIGIGEAVKAAAAAATTSQHAAEATLADSRALDADRNAQEHAKNAAKYRAEAERQAQRAAELAEAAKKQQEIAIAARDRAAQQKQIAQQKAEQARGHAANARNARASAQNAAANAAARAKAAFAARATAGELGANHDAAMAKVRQTSKEVELSNTLFSMRLIGANTLQLQLEAAEQRAREQGQNVEEATRGIRAQATAARAEANAAEAWAGRARAAAATAQSEAGLAERAARDARAAADRATGEAVTARRAADEAYRLTLEATNAALASKASAEMTQAEAEGAVREANQSVFQSVIADRAAEAASASASVVVDSVRVAEAILRQFAGINADARKALEITSQSLVVSEEQSRSAREKADEAGQAAVSARKAADDAILEVKPAYEAAARAADSANEAAQHALTANTAANDAAKHAADAHGAATTATQWATTARQDAMLAKSAAANAGASAASANQAAASTERIADMAEESYAGVQAFLESVAEQIQDVHQYRQRLDMAEQIAREEAERKRVEINNKFAIGVAWLAICSEGWPTGNELTDKFCREGMNRIKDYANRAIDELEQGTRELLMQAGRCAGGDEHACQVLRDGQTKLQQFYRGIQEGFVEGAKGTLDGFIAVADCVTGAFGTCKQILEGMWYTLQNPHVLIHLEEWLDNPAKAIGLTYFDLSMFAVTVGAGSGGSAITKGVSGALKGLGRGAGRVVKDAAHLDGLLAKIADNVPTRLPNSLAEILNINVRFDGDLAKIDGAIADIDGQLYRVEKIEIRPEGNTSSLDGAIVRLEVGKVRIEDGLVKVDDPKLKVEPPKPCAAGLMAAAAGTGCPDFEQYDDKTGIYTARENGVEMRLEPNEYNGGDALRKQAQGAESDVTGLIDELDRSIPGSARVGQGLEVKSSKSLLRKLYQVLHPVDAKGNALPPPTLDGALRKINDSLRYTLVFAKETYTENVLDALRKLDANPDYEVTVVKNFWADRMAQEGNSYRGINVTLETKNGLQFELQFHTRESFDAKEAEHGLYDQIRLATEDDVLERLRIQSDKIFGKMQTPVGAPGIPGRKPGQ